MSELNTFLGLLSGLRLLRAEIPLPTLVAMMIVVNICDAVMCRLFAHNNGYPKNLWTVIGLVFGIWGMAALIVMPKREKRSAPA